VITSIKWAPNGDYFAVGSFEMLRLCDRSGWSYSFHKPNCGSLLKLSWSHDGTVIAGAGGNGAVAFGYIVDRNLSWGHIEAVLDEDNKISVNDCIHEISEDLDFRERVVNLSLKHGHMVVCTTSQCYVYTVSNWSSPFVFDVKDTIYLIVQGAKYFALIDASQNFHIYNYEGKIISSPKYQGLRVEFLNARHLSLSSDILAVIDPTNQKIVRIFDIISGKPSTVNIEHSAEIIEMDLNQVEMASERKMCFIDSNRDMFLTMIHKPDIMKIASIVDSFQWNDGNDMLACISDGKLLTWFYPNAIYVDRDLMTKAMAVKDASDVGKLAKMTLFTGNFCTVRRLDGALATLSISPYPKMLYEHVDKADFEKAIRICRFVKENTLWACLAAMSIYCRELNTVEIALAAIDEADKVQFINYIKDLPSEPSRNAALALYCKKINEAE
jgi:intraflagellar transport protein 80